MRIVIADDSEGTRLGIERLIAVKFPQFIIDGSFEDGASLMEYLNGNVPDLMITDICMPGFDGLEACKKLREVSSTSNIILITAYKDFEYAKCAITYHVHDLLVKPFTSKQLVDSILSALNKSNAYLDDERETPNTSQQFMVKKAKEYIKTHYSDMNLSVAKVADSLHVTPNYLSSVFSSESNCKLSSYIGQIRVEQAKKLLLSTDFSFQKIATAIGCTSVQYFYKLFKKETGMTPSEYQQRKRL